MANRNSLAQRPRPSLFRALGPQDPPEFIDIAGRQYRQQEVYKHDSWAATALYRDVDLDTNTASLNLPAQHIVVCKFNRQYPILGLPMKWLGRRLARREQRALVKLQHIEGLPAACDSVYQAGEKLEYAVAHEYLPGHPLQANEQVNDAFFPELTRMLDELHAAGFAYVDLHKRENVLVGRDSKPKLIDFQVSFQPPGRVTSWLPGYTILCELLQRTDRFCLYKHVRHHRPDLLPALGYESAQAPPWWIRLHRVVAVPFRQARRRLLTWLRIRDRSGKATSEQFAEHAFRCPNQ